MEHSQKRLERLTCDEPNTTANLYKRHDNNVAYCTFAQVPADLRNHWESDQFGTSLSHISTPFPDPNKTADDDFAKYNADIDSDPDPVPDSARDSNPYSADCTQCIARRY